MHGTDDVDDERRPASARTGAIGTGAAWLAVPHEQMPCPEHEDDGQKERAGDESPARRGEGVQHVVNCDNECSTRG